MNITSIDKIENQRKIAILDTSSISFLQHLKEKENMGNLKCTSTTSKSY